MGFFNDYRSANRDTFKFVYTGGALEPFAKAKYRSFTEKEQEARRKVAALLSDPDVKSSDPKIDALKGDIEKFGTEREKCLVWAHEFVRVPEKEYYLALGDVTYFDIAKLPE